MKVNILLSTYNGEQYLKEQVKSIQDQTYQDWQLLIRDDGSTDGTVKIIQELVAQDERIRFINQGAIENLGVIKSFHALLKYEKADLKVVDENLNVQHESMIRTQSDHANTELIQELTENTVTGGVAMINHALADLWTGQEKHALLMHDWYLALLATAFGKLIYIDRPTELYRQHSSNVLGARTLRKRVKNWVRPHILFAKYWNLIESSQEQAKNLLDLPVSSQTKEIIENFVTIMDVPLRERLRRIRQYGYRKNRTFHTVVFTSLILTKFAYRGKK